MVHVLKPNLGLPILNQNNTKNVCYNEHQPYIVCILNWSFIQTQIFLHFIMKNIYISI